MRFDVITHPRTDKYLAELPDNERAVVLAHLEKLGTGEFSAVRTKQLDGPVRELIIGNHRLSYFLIGPALHFVSGFRKKSRKTPRAEIAYAWQIYNLLNLK